MVKGNIGWRICVSAWVLPSPQCPRASQTHEVKGAAPHSRTHLFGEWRRSVEHGELTHAPIQVGCSDGALEKKCACGGGDWTWAVDCTLWQLKNVDLRCGTSEMAIR